MSKYKKKRSGISNRPKGWTKNNLGFKFYYKNNWIICYGSFGITYCVIDELYNMGFYITRNKQEFLEERRKLAYRNSPVWKAMHGEYNDE